MFITRSRPTRAFRSVVQALPTLDAHTTIPGYDGLLPITELDKDLEIKMPWWIGIEEEMRLQIGFKPFTPTNPNEPGDADLVGVYHPVSAAEAADSSTVFSLYLPKALLTHGVYLLNVRTLTVPGGQKETTASIRIEVDTVAPGGGALPYLKFNQPVEVSLTIGDEDIIDGKLPAFLAHYEGIKPGDTVTPIIQGVPQPGDAIEIPDPVPITEFIPFGYSEAALLAVNGDLRALGYSVQDKAGNADKGREQFFTIDLDSKPAKLLAPRVPRADDGLIDDADARTPVQVHIPKFDNAREHDEIVVHWGDQVADPVELEKDDLIGDPFIGVQIPYLFVVNAGNGTVQVKYEVFRKGSLVGTSPNKPVVVDIELIGGPDPDPGNPWHGNLLAPKIISDSGNGEENVIPPEDFDKNAHAVIAWRGKDGTEIYKEKDKILLTWGDQTAQVLRTIELSDVNDKMDLVLTVPSTTIGSQGSGEIPVFYTASRLTSVPPFENTSLSPKQDVKVTNKDELPGGGTIAAPNFTVLNDEFGAIGPGELITGPEGLHNPVQVATNYTHAKVGDTLELFFVGYDALTGGNPVPGAAYNPQPPYELQQPDLDRGYYEFRVPARHHYAVCTRGAVEAYVVVTGKGPVRSLPKRVSCHVKEAGWEDCNNRP